MDRTQYTTLVEVLNQVPDYCKRKGRQHRSLTLLSLIAMALASAQRTPQAIARWVCEHRDDLFAVLRRASRACREAPPCAARSPGWISARWNRLRPSSIRLARRCPRLRPYQLCDSSHAIPG